MKNQITSKKGQILAHLQRGSTITPRQAIALYGSFRLASTINRLREEGFEIETKIQYNLHAELYAEYKLMM